MRRIEKRKDRAKKIFMGAVMVFLMIASGFGIYLNSRQSQADLYNGYEFDVVTSGNNQVYVTEVGDKKPYFYNYPTYVENIQFDDAIPDKLRNSRMIYLTYNPETISKDFVAWMFYDLQQSMSQDFGTFFTNGFTKNSSFQAPIITCQDATEFVPVILFEESNQTNITQEDNCIILHGQNYEVTRLRDRLMYGVHGIINGQEEII